MLFYFAYCDNQNIKINVKYFIIPLILTAIFGFVCSAIPSEKDIYKIAATIGQDKTVLSPLGEVK